MTLKLGMAVDLCMTIGLDTRSQWINKWISREKQYLSYGIQTVRDSRFMHDIHVQVCFNDLVLDYENICKARPACLCVLFFTVFRA